jgi:hypothetical protein
LVKLLKFFDADPVSGMEKIWIRDPGLNIPDTQHWFARIWTGLRMHAILTASSGVDDISALLKCEMPLYFLSEIL